MYLPYGRSVWTVMRFYSVDVWMKGLSTFAVAVGTVIVRFYFGMAWRKNLLQYHLPGGYSIGILI